jgi:hypothetical protein
MLVAVLKKILRIYNREPHISSNQLIDVILHIVHTYIELKISETEKGFLAASYVMEVRKKIREIR